MAVRSDLLLVFTLQEQSFALPLAAVESVTRAVIISALPSPPPGVLGVINVRGEIVPVYDLRPRFGLLCRALRATDSFVLARVGSRFVAVLAEAVIGISTPQEQPVAAGEILPGLDSLAGVVKQEGKMVFIQDLERFLSGEDAAALAGQLAS